MPKLRTVIETEERRGTGSDGDPVRLVRQFYDLDGTLLMEDDAWQQDESRSRQRDAYTAICALCGELDHGEIAHVPTILAHAQTAKRALEGKRGTG